jgi:hypothetical protein
MIGDLDRFKIPSASASSKRPVHEIKGPLETKSLDQRREASRHLWDGLQPSSHGWRAEIWGHRKWRAEIWDHRKGQIADPVLSDASLLREKCGSWAKTALLILVLCLGARQYVAKTHYPLEQPAEHSDEIGLT